MRRFTFAVAVWAATLIARPGYAQTRAAGPPPDAAPAQPAGAIDPQFQADILRLLDVMHIHDRVIEGGRTVFQTLRPQLLASLPATPKREQITDAFQNRLLELFDTQEFTDHYLALYAKLLSDEDVKGLIAFYETPAGMHYNAVFGQLATGGSQLGQDLAREHITDILHSLCKDYPELNGQAAFCPAARSSN
jgi:uncharacterized protein